MINLSLTKEQFKELLLNYELGKLLKGDVVEDDSDTILKNKKLEQLLYKSGVDADIASDTDGKFQLSEKFENEVDSIYEKFIDFVLSGEYEKQMENLMKEMEEMRKNKK